eukprot:Gregarina_sp_Poly_1__3416@NODE_1991_length_2929_cov_23_608665_g1285_i0_p1_GENE_NODE_1991_length_2929_cov_23_608665_g1285_i0NODE_1991_length_2929_cov_23_608665_g1285_i0_p1_ORF_typecomplete_len472_score45_38DUF4716/PF15837_5/0_046_NODE_1991_length_2929_cov_23_608665_g1285_i05361951
MSSEEDTVTAEAATQTSVSEDGSFTQLPAEEDIASCPPNNLLLGVAITCATILPFTPTDEESRPLIWRGCLLIVFLLSPLIPMVGLKAMGVAATFATAGYNIYLYFLTEWSLSPLFVNPATVVFLIGRGLLWLVVLVTLCCVASAHDSMTHLATFTLAFGVSACLALIFKFIMLSQLDFSYKQEMFLISPCSSLVACALAFATLPPKRTSTSIWSWRRGLRTYGRTILVLNDSRFLAIMFSVFGISLAKSMASLLPQQYSIEGLAESLFFQLIGEYLIYLLIVPITLWTCKFPSASATQISGNLLTFNILINGLLILSLVSLSLDRLTLSPIRRRVFESFDFRVLYEDLLNTSIICLPQSLSAASEAVLFISLLWFMSHFCPTTHLAQAWAWLIAMKGFSGVFVSLLGEYAGSKIIETAISSVLFVLGVATFGSLIFVAHIPAMSFLCPEDIELDDNITTSNHNTTLCADA